MSYKKCGKTESGTPAFVKTPTESAWCVMKTVAKSSAKSSAKSATLCRPNPPCSARFAKPRLTSALGHYFCMSQHFSVPTLFSPHEMFLLLLLPPSDLCSGISCSLFDASFYRWKQRFIWYSNLNLSHFFVISSPKSGIRLQKSCRSHLESPCSCYAISCSRLTDVKDEVDVFCLSTLYYV